MDIADVPHFIQKVAIRGPTFRDLAEIAKGQLREWGGHAEIVCGPISTGGYGRPIANLLVFNHAIEVLKAHGRPVWSQVPFEAGLAELHHEWMKCNPHATYCLPIMTEFYWPILTPELVSRAWFIDGEYGWETSTGAKMEWQRLGELGIDRRLFKDEWHRMCVLPTDL
ncbi:MAG: hypothetical protein KBE09_00025 [Candidatus Pacebacteria bacterium]|nr:hypothetical protein [Candidatus Paceibacterota bacterium]